MEGVSGNRFSGSFPTGWRNKVLSVKLMDRFLELFYRNEYAFAARIMRWAFGIYFLLVGVKKLRVDGRFSPVDGIISFAESLPAGAMNTAILAREIPDVMLLGYGYTLPFAELGAGALLLANRHVNFAYVLVAFLFLSFIFGQMYSGNTAKIGTDYLPSLVALCVAAYAHQKSN